MTIFWHRRDLRNHDNAGLYEALKAEKDILPIFIFDRHILDKLSNKADARVSFLHQAVTDLQAAYQAAGGSLRVFYGFPEEVFPQLLAEYPPITAVYTNRDYEPYANARDGKIAALLENKGLSFKTFKDHIIFEGHEVQKNDGGPYTVFSPYARKWRAKLEERPDTYTNEEGEEVAISYYLKPYPTSDYFSSLLAVDKPFSIPSLADMGFEASDISIPPTAVSRKLIREYDKKRNFPAVQGTSRLGVHFRHGTISIREKALRAKDLNDTYFNELIWRDFYSQILQHFPHVATSCFRPEYEGIPWENKQAHFEAWCAGKTGVPLVDAGMRELNETGFMHNRIRMLVASYLTKHLLVNWQWGEAYFAEKLLDFDLASNNGGWQWAAGCGTDAQPYFRIFNAESQQQKFDPDEKYIRRWVPEYGTKAYPAPLVEHKFGRERAIAVYKEALAKAKG